MKAIRRFAVRIVLPERLAALDGLATNLRWSWHAPTRELFESIDPSLWVEVGRDPVRLLGEIQAERWARLAEDDGFIERVGQLRADLDDYLTADRWYQQSLTDAPRAIAYFSPEFGVTSVLPQYSGGLGILAGDHLKTASDLGVSLVAVGLFYRSGYFRQTLSLDGWQLEHYPVQDPDGRPVTLLREPDGSPAHIHVPLGTSSVRAHIWVAQVGRVPLLLLDSDLEENGAAERQVTDRLYGGGTDHRLAQELLLGAGGVRAIRTYCRITGFAEPEVYHTNEGHAGFQGVERMREFIATGLEFDTALEAVRAGTVFTTHTPVPAGIDRFPMDLISTQLAQFAADGLTMEQLLALGEETYSGGDPGVFNMAVMGLRLAQRANGVSKLHGLVSREMFAPLWPGFDPADVPITSITNGVHAPTWVAPEMLAIAAERGHGSLNEDPGAWRRLEHLSDEDIWWTKRRLRERLVSETRQRTRKSWLARGASEAELGWVDGVLDPDVLTIGFARRVPTYKRLTLMLEDPERLRRLMLDEARPVQFVIAGKAHPADETGKRLIQELVQFADSEDVRHRIVFLPNYDIGLAQVLYPGCDIWLNNPLRPLEACGTSGMKAALNGALNLSVLDGWWDEWFDGRNGWAIPTAEGVTDPERRDSIEAAALYDLIEKSVARSFYDRDDRGISSRWTSMVRHTLSDLGPKVLATRMLHDYVTTLYVPAAQASRSVSAENFQGAKDFAAWKAKIREAWPSIAVEHVEASGLDQNPTLGSEISVRALVQLDGLTASDVEVQMLIGRVNADDRLVEPELFVLAPDGVDGTRQRFEGAVSLSRTGPVGYTVRVVPKHIGLASWAELGLLAEPIASGVSAS